MKKGIAIIGNIPNSAVNAAYLRINSFIKIFSYLGYSSFVIGESECEKQISDNMTYFGIRRPSNIFGWVRKYFSAKKIIDILNKIDNLSYVFVDTYYYFPTKKILRWCKKKKITFILVADEWYGKSHFRFPKNLLKDFDTHMFIKFASKTKNLICISNYLKDNVSNSNQNVIVFPCIAEYFYDEIQPFTFDKKNINIVFVGRIDRFDEKESIIPVINAIHCVNKDCFGRKIILHIVGSSGCNDDDVFYYGLIEHNKCLSMIKGADFTIIPRKKTRKNQAGFPTKLSESFFCGTPVISTNTSDISLYLNKNNGIIVEECEQSLFVSAFKHVQTLSSEDMKELRTNALKSPLKTLDFLDTFISFLKNCYD